MRHEKVEGGERLRKEREREREHCFFSGKPTGLRGSFVRGFFSSRSANPRHEIFSIVPLPAGAHTSSSLGSRDFPLVRANDVIEYSLSIFLSLFVIFPHRSNDFTKNLDRVTAYVPFAAMVPRSRRRYRGTRAVNRETTSPRTVFRIREAGPSVLRAFHGPR